MSDTDPNNVARDMADTIANKTAKKSADNEADVDARKSAGNASGDDATTDATTDAKQRLATRLAFLCSGMAMSAWAPLVPFVKARMGLSAAELGMLVLCIGVGSIAAMPLAGPGTARFGCRAAIVLSGILVCLVTPALAIVPSPFLLGLALFVFGASIGTMDVAMNIQAVIVEQKQGGSLMSGFHGLFSVGGFVGAGGVALLLWCGLSPFTATVILALLVAAALWYAEPHFLGASTRSTSAGASFVMPHGTVIFIGLLCFACFLAEGAVLDWSALLLSSGGRFTAEQGGMGYAAFAMAMTVGRLTGDKVVGRFGSQRVMIAGGLCAASGFFITVAASSPWLALFGFLLVGIGASNIVPILFTAAGRQPDMPPSLAIGAITTLGYAGILAGPALIGFVAEATSLHAAFGLLAGAMLLVALCALRPQLHARV
jgi:predicted MFS family arabinose efflux permease